MSQNSPMQGNDLRKSTARYVGPSIQAGLCVLAGRRDGVSRAYRLLRRQSQCGIRTLKRLSLRAAGISLSDYGVIISSGRSRTTRACSSPVASRACRLS